MLSFFAILIAIALALGELWDIRQRPLSEWPAEDLRRIYRFGPSFRNKAESRGTMSHAEYRDELHRQQIAIEAELRRRGLR